MPRMPLSETSAKWALPITCIVFALIWLFNAYKLGRLRINLTFRQQLLLSIGIVLLACIAATLFKHWICVSIGFVLCGLLWIIHPAIESKDSTSSLHAKTILWIRLAGIVLILIGIFSRIRFY